MASATSGAAPSICSRKIVSVPEAPPSSRAASCAVAQAILGRAAALASGVGSSGMLSGHANHTPDSTDTGGLLAEGTVSVEPSRPVTAKRTPVWVGSGKRRW